MPSWLTLTLTALFTAAPNLISVIPQPYGAIASGIIGLGASLYHLFQEPPTAK